MAYVANGNQDDENKNNVSVNGGGGSVHLAPSSGVGAVGAGAGTSNNGQGAGGGNFATINQYLNANQDQAQPLANQLTSGINKQYDTLAGQNQQVASDLNSAVNSGYTKQDSGLLAQEAANPVSFAQDANNVSKFQGQLNDKYTGPQSAESTDAFTKQQANLNSAISQGQSATQTEAGRQGMLSGIEKTPTGGVTALNSAILSQNPNSQSQIEHAYDPFKGLVSGLNQSGQDINKQIASAQSSATGAANQAGSQLQNQFNGLNSSLTGTLNKAQGDVNNYNKGIADYQTSLSTMQPFIGAVQGSGLLGTLKMNDPFAQKYSAMEAPTINSVASQNDLATQNAINSLAGNNNAALIDPNAAVGGYQAPGAMPQAPDYSGILDQIALGAAKGYAPNGGIAGPDYTNNAVNASALLDTGHNNFNTNPDTTHPANTQYAIPFGNLMQQLSGYYGNKYVQSGVNPYFNNAWGNDLQLVK